MPRIASIQTDVIFNNPAANAAAVISKIAELGLQSIAIVVFPECMLTGYCVSTPADAAAIAIDRDCQFIKAIDAQCQLSGVIAVVGFAEREREVLYNTAALFSPGYPVRFYRKTHLPELGYDRFVKAGDEVCTFDTAIGVIGIMICFDIRHPELARCLALEGADLLCVPTNWPTGATVSADLLALARAVENKVFVITSNRVGDENGFSFIGKSKIISPSGDVLATAELEECTLISDCDFAEARNKRTVTVPRIHETTVFESRRPELYGRILHHN